MTAGRALGVGLLLVGIGGCRQILGADEYGVKGAQSGPVVGKCDHVRHLSAKCAACTDANCCDQATACNQEPACNAMATCLAKCTPEDHECRGSCNLTIPHTAEFTALSTCEAKSKCSACASARVVWGRAECDECLAETCGAALDAFSADPSELHAEPCSSANCSSVLPECACDSYETAEAPTASALLSCAQGTCAADCSPAEDWSCLGKMQNPSPKVGSGGTLDLHLSLANPSVGMLAGTPIKHFRVAACGEGSVGCGSDPNSGVTSDLVTGEAILQVAWPKEVGQNETFFGHLYVDAQGENTSDVVYAPALVYFFPPLRQGTTHVTRRVVSQTLAGSFADASGDSLDWGSLGGVVWSGTSCEGGASGMTITFTGKPNGAPTPTVHYIPASATETGSDGTGFAWNIVPGFYTLTAKHGEDVVGTYPITVEKGAITHLIIRPI